jgi:hypothetical protein
MRTVLLAGVAALVSGGSCIEFDRPEYGFHSTEVRWRVDERRDVVEWLEIEHGLVFEKEQHLSGLLEVLDGARVFPAHGGFPCLDLDEIERDLSRQPEAADAESEEGEPDPEDLAFHELAPTFSIVEAAVVIDEEGRASLWRRGRLESAAKWVRLFEDKVLEDIAESKPREPGEPPQEFPVPEMELEDASWELLRAHVTDGGRLWRFDRDSFQAEIPMTQQDAERLIRELDRDDVEASFRDGLLRLRYLPDAGGWIRSRFLELDFTDEKGLPEYDPRFVFQLVFSGATVEPVERYRERLAAAGLR